VLVERSELQIKDGMEDDFSAAMMERGVTLLSRVPGVTSVQFGRGVENPGKFILLVEWTTMDTHTAFKSHPVYPEFSQLLKPFVKAGAMEHFNIAQVGRK
jgi:heme-degrading monooxygenase HmoA